MNVIKDLFTSLLIVVCIIIVLCVVFYDKISLSRVIPESEEYLLSSEMKQELDDTNLDDNKEVIVEYYIDAADLNRYEKANEYNKGKSNPFAEVDTSTSENTNENNGENNGSSSNNNSGNFYEDDGTK